MTTTEKEWKQEKKEAKKALSQLTGSERHTLVNWTKTIPVWKDGCDVRHMNSSYLAFSFYLNTDSFRPTNAQMNGALLEAGFHPEQINQDDEWSIKTINNF